jgi:hypothetical protein
VALARAHEDRARRSLILRLLRNEDYPSWGFEIRMGATTMWERWNSIRADGEFRPVDMNSFNHYAYGAVGDWMFQHLVAWSLRIHYAHRANPTMISEPA